MGVNYSSIPDSGRLVCVCEHPKFNLLDVNIIRMGIISTGGTLEHSSDVIRGVLWGNTLGESAQS